MTILTPNIVINDNFADENLASTNIIDNMAGLRERAGTKFDIR